MPGGRSLYHRRPGRFAQQREEFRRLVRRLKRLRSSYSLRELASELGVTNVTVTQWLRGHTPMARPEHVERLKNFYLRIALAKSVSKKPIPEFVAPMMASVVKEPFDGPDWIFETKLDGYRAIAVIDSTGKARIWSRNRLPLEQKFPTVRYAAEQLNLRSTILDGEIVALDEEGIPRFQLLQKWQKRPTAPVVYVLFDLLWDKGRDLTGKSVVH